MSTYLSPDHPPPNNSIMTSVQQIQDILLPIIIDIRSIQIAQENQNFKSVIPIKYQLHSLRRLESEQQDLVREMKRWIYDLDDEDDFNYVVRQGWIELLKDDHTESRRLFMLRTEPPSFQKYLKKHPIPEPKAQSPDEMKADLKRMLSAALSERELPKPTVERVERTIQSIAKEIDRHPAFPKDRYHTSISEAMKKLDF